MGTGAHARGRVALAALRGVGIGLASAIVILGLAVLPLFTPAWIDGAQERAGVAALTGFDPGGVRQVSASLVRDLLPGGGDFGVALDGGAVLSDAERGHLRDVRLVLTAFGLGVGAAAVVVGVAFGRSRAAPEARTAVLAAVRAGALGLAAAIVVLAVGVVVAFETAFDIFHRLLFSGGNWSFDPARDRLVQLFPMSLWQETALAAGVLVLVLAGAFAWLAGRALRRMADR